MDAAAVDHDVHPFDHQENNEDEEEFVLPAGFKFKPNDEDLCLEYLAKKIANQPLPHNSLIKSVNLYNYDPDSLTRMYKKPHQQQEDSDSDSDDEEIEDNWYFFTPREKLYKNGKRPSRLAGAGFWRATTSDTNIRRKTGKMEVIGKKKKLDYFRGSPGSAVKTNWIMEEFVLVCPPSDLQTHITDNNNMVLNEWVVCRIYEHKPRRHQENHQQQQHTVDNGLPSSSYHHQPATIIEANDQDHHHQDPLNNGYYHIEPSVQRNMIPMPFDHQPVASRTDNQAPTSIEIIQPNQHHFQDPCYFDQAMNLEVSTVTEIIQANQDPLNNGYYHIEPSVQSNMIPMPFDHQPVASSTDNQAPTAIEIIQPNQHLFQDPCYFDQAMNLEVSTVTEIIQANQDPWNFDWDFEDGPKVDLDELLKTLDEW